MTKPLREGRQPTDVPLPGMQGMPEFPPGEVDPQLVAREDSARRARQRIKDRRKIREEIDAWLRAGAGGAPTAYITVAFHVRVTGVDAVVDWATPGVGGPRLLRRVSGPLRLDGRAVRSLGPDIALLRLLRALGEVLDQ